MPPKGWTKASIVDGMKACTRCKLMLPLSDFSLMSDGRLRYPHCKLCENGRMRDRNAHRRDVLGMIKTTAGCMDCGYDTNPVALDFDHRPGEEKLFPVGLGARTKSWVVIWAEIDKCDVRCANCHRIRTAERGYNYTDIKVREEV